MMGLLNQYKLALLILVGATGSVMVVYFLIMSMVNSDESASEQFKSRAKKAAIGTIILLCIDPIVNAIKSFFVLFA
jgi:NADH:ubiquinone oxidoreductase subunit 6 (subunit J)